MKNSTYSIHFFSTIALLCVSLFANAGTFTSHTSGNWNAGAAVWTIVGDADGIPDADDDIIITSGTTVIWGQTTTQFCRDLTVNAGGVLQGKNNFSRTLRIHGNHVNNGTETLAGTIFYMGSGTTISGSGTFSTLYNWAFLTDRTLLAGATVSKGRWIRLYNGADFTNRGTLTCQSSVIAYNAASVFTNENNLTIRASNFMTTGTFNSHFVGNTVTLHWNPAITGNENIPNPSAGYYNVIVNASSSHYKFTADMIIANDLTINNTSPVLNFDVFDLNIGGDWTNNGGSLTSAGSSTITFDGSGTQVISHGTNPQQGLFTTIIDINSTLQLNTDLNINGDFTVLGAMDATAANHNVTVNGDVNITGTLDMQNGEFTFNGSSAQTMDASGTINFYDLTIQNSSTGVTLNTGTYTIDNNVVVNDGGLNTNGNGFTLLANGTQSARIRFINAGTSITGNVTLQRNLPAGSADYRDLSNPFTGGIDFSQWDDDLIISGTGFPDGCAYGGGCFASIKTFDAFSQTYSDVTNVTDPMENSIGYEAFLGDDLNTFNGVQLDVTGTVNGAAGFLQNVRAGWNLVGNPYACEIDWHSMSLGAGVGDFFYIYDSGTGNFEYYEVTGPGTGTASGNINTNGIIASMQGFWVNTNSNTNLVFGQSSKTEASVDFVRSTGTIDRDQLAITIKNNDNDYSCKSTVRFDALAIDNTDDYDVPMFRGPERPTVRKSPLLFFRNSDGTDVRLNALNYDYAISKTIDVWMNTEIDGRFTISANDVDVFGTYKCVFLNDKFTGESVNLRKSDYTFTQLASTEDLDRFEILLSNESNCDIEEIASLDDNSLDYVIGYSEEFVRVTLFEDQSSITTTSIKVFNMLGELVEVATFSGNTFDINKSNLSPGMYIVQMNNGLAESSAKFVIK